MTSLQTAESHLHNELASTLLDQFEYAYNGSLSFAEVSITLLIDGSGYPIGFCGIVHDISQRKQEEERRR
jgi:PAS domain S-box-containing protein